MYGITLLSLEGERNLNIQGIAFDSRKVKEGFLFVAVKGLTTDGHQYIDQAVTNGASAVLIETEGLEVNHRITLVRTDNSAKSLGIIAANFYGNPSEKLKLVGITGTNGKTTTATLSFELFQHLGYKVGLLSTVENRIDHKVLPATFTTPDALQLNELLSRMVEAGCTHCFMEVSSHALSQHRTSGLSFSGGVFTNISHDHLDYHQTFDEYIKAKKILFDGLPASAFALVNVDDKRGNIMLQNTKAERCTFSIKSMADFRARVIHNTMHGLELDMDGINVWFKLIGDFNAYNLLTVYAVAALLGEEREEVLRELSQLDGARGRFEYVKNKANIMAIVDYAHTPDALENVLQTIESLRTKNELLITVVGCGGDRDKEKRPKMARIATTLSDKVILTSDNPRSEDPEAILADMFAGVMKSDQRKTVTIIDRKEAIRTACNMARDNDIILVAGKGHETYQEVNGERFPFDDKAILNDLLNPEA